MVTAATTAFTDLGGAIGELVMANIGVAIAIVVGGIIIGYIRRA
jgi:FtsH-binding integral membrane protein